tara:strand:- start:650 stop:1006 length:357 start_codon:yes stop_codon:yes gene_type:complete
MLTERTAVMVDNITENGQIHVRDVTVISRDGVEISQSHPHRRVIHPGKDYSQEPPKVQAICQSVHTPLVVAEFQVSHWTNEIVQLLKQQPSNDTTEALNRANVELTKAQADLVTAIGD